MLIRSAAYLAGYDCIGIIRPNLQKRQNNSYRLFCHKKASDCLRY